MSRVQTQHRSSRSVCLVIMSSCDTEQWFSDSSLCQDPLEALVTHTHNVAGLRLEVSDLVDLGCGSKFPFLTSFRDNIDAAGPWAAL